MKLHNKVIGSILGTVGLLSLFLFNSGNNSFGATILFPSGGGTGTSTAPTFGQLLVGNAGGTYTLTATSSLGISASPGGSTTQVQFNDSGSFGGDPDFTWDKTDNELGINLNAGASLAKIHVAGQATETVAPVTNLSISIVAETTDPLFTANNTTHTVIVYAYNTTLGIYDAVGATDSELDNNDGLGKKISVTWTASADAEGYYVYYQNGDKYINVGNVTSYSLNGYDLGTPANTTLSFSVPAGTPLFNADNDPSTWTATVYAYNSTTGEISPVGGTDSQPDPNDSTDYNIDLSWDAVTGAGGYYVYLDTTDQYVDVGNVLTTTLSGDTSFTAGSPPAYRWVSGAPTLTPTSTLSGTTNTAFFDKGIVHVNIDPTEITGALSALRIRSTVAYGPGIILFGSSASSAGFQFYNETLGDYAGFFGVASKNGDWGGSVQTYDFSFGAQRGGNLHFGFSAVSGNPTTKLFVKNSNGYVGIGDTLTSPSARLHVIDTTAPLRIGYNTSNYFTGVVSSAGLTTFDAVGSGAAFSFSDRVQPTTNDGAPLGSTTLQWSDLFLAEGGVINWDNGDATLTQTGNTVALAGAGLDIQGSLQADSITNDTGLAHGTYTPTLTNVTNISASTAYPAQYMRVGNTVTVSGKVDIDTTSPGAAELGLSLPIASNFANDYECAGTFIEITAAPDTGYIKADATNNRASFNQQNTDTTNHSHYFTFTYQVI